MLKLFIVIFIELFLFQNVFAQYKTIDSLKNVLPSLKDIARINCLNDLAFEYSNPYWNKSHYVQTDTALIYATEAKKESSQLHYVRGFGMAMKNFGMIEEQRRNFILSEQFTRQAASILKRSGTQYDYYLCIVNTGWCAFNEAKYKEAIYYYKQVIPYLQSIKDDTHVAMLYRMTGNNYVQQGYFDSAFYFFEQNNEIKKSMDDINGIIHTTDFKGDMYLTAGDTAKAISFYLQSATSAKAKHVVDNHDYTTMFLVFNLKHEYDSALMYLKQDIQLIKSASTDSFLIEKNLMVAYMQAAELYLHLNNYDSAITYCKKPLQAIKNGGCINSLMIILKTLATAYEEKNNYAKTLLYTNQLLDYAYRANATPLICYANAILWKLYDKNHNIQLAYNYHLKYTELNNLLERNNYKAKIAAWDAITKMNLEEANYKSQIQSTQEKANMKIAVVNRQKQLQLYIFILIFVIIGLLIITFTRNIQLNRRKEQLQFQANQAKAQLEVAALKQQATILEMQALRSQMNPHFVFNCLSSINSFILKNKTEEASDYLTKFSRLIRMVLNNSKQSFISLEDELEMLRLYLEMERLRFKNSFDYSFTYNNSVESGNIFIPPLLFQPFAENAIWHGLMHKQEKGVLNFDFHTEEKILICIITDNGVGRKNAALLKSRSVETQKSMGLKITTERLSLLNNNSNEHTFFIIEDLYDENGNANGTRVHLKLSYKELLDV